MKHKRADTKDVLLARLECYDAAADVAGMDHVDIRLDLMELEIITEALRRAQ